MRRRSLLLLVFLSGVGGMALGAALAGMGAGRERVSQTEDALVTGIGGVFFKARDPERLRAWYREHLGIDAGAYGVNFYWREADGAGGYGRTVWSVFPEDSDYFGRGGQDLMINYRVEDLDALLAKLRSQGVEQVGEVEEYWYGRFAWVIDGEDNRVELWEPDDYSPQEFEQRMKRELSNK